MYYLGKQTESFPCDLSAKIKKLEPVEYTVLHKKFMSQLLVYIIEMINNRARHNLIDAKCRWRSDQLDGAASFKEPLGQTKVMQIRQREGDTKPT